jgi:hypothetical protein
VINAVILVLVRPLLEALQLVPLSFETNIPPSEVPAMIFIPEVEELRPIEVRALTCGEVRPV